MHIKRFGPAIAAIVMLTGTPTTAVEPGSSTERFVDAIQEGMRENAQEIRQSGRKVPPQQGVALSLKIEIVPAQLFVQNSHELPIKTRIQNSDPEGQRLQ